MSFSKTLRELEAMGGRYAEGAGTMRSLTRKASKTNRAVMQIHAEQILRAARREAAGPRSMSWASVMKGVK